VKDIFDQPLPSAETALDQLVGLVDPHVGIIRYLAEEQDYAPDEPGFVLWRSELAPTSPLSDGGYRRVSAVGGRGLTATEARIGAVFEALERYCLSIYRRGDLTVVSHRASVAAGADTLDPVDLAGAPARPHLRDRPLSWTTATSVLTGNPVRVPAQLVYLPYAFPDGEPVLRDPLTTGAASGMGVGFAVRNGLLEVVERDAVMLLHYRRPRSPALASEVFAGTDVQWLLAELDRHGLDCTLFHVDAGLPAHVVVCRVDDPTGIGPAQSVGSKAATSVVDAARGAILEAALLRRALRLRAAKVRTVAEHYLPDLSAIDCLEARSHVWAQREMTGHLRYLTAERAEVIQRAEEVPDRWRGDLALVEATAAAGGDVLVADVTTPEVAGLGVCVVKVLVPGLQPMHLSEQHVSWTRRLLTFGGHVVAPSELTSIPHPFL
jgi:ribosomal protein S12 methylthiotransferase accessory factor